MLSLQGFHCFIICLLRHCSVLGVSFCVLRHNAISSGFPLSYHLFVTSLFCSRLQLSPLMFVMSLYYLFKDSIVSLPARYVTALGFDCSIFCLLGVGLL